MSFIAFQPTGTTKLVAASSSTASTPTQVSTGGQQTHQVANGSSSQYVFVTAGSSSVQAAAPTTATPCTGVAIPPFNAVNMSIPPAGWLSAATTAGSASVYATPGNYGS